MNVAQTCYYIMLNIIYTPADLDTTKEEIHLFS